MFWPWLLLGEHVTSTMLGTAGFVLLCAALASRSRVRVLAIAGVASQPATARIS